MNRTQRLLTEEAPPDTRAIPCSRDPAYASDQTSEISRKCLSVKMCLMARIHKLSARPWLCATCPRASSILLSVERSSAATECAERQRICRFGMG
jgi:hypothetical protein